MTKIYCTKCGVTGDSKCPHCRSIFQDPAPVEVQGAQDYFENFMFVKADPDSIPGADGKRRYFVTFWTYADSEEQALGRVLPRLRSAMINEAVNLKVAGCVHDWQIWPGMKSEIGCGHEGDPDAVVPPNPYAK